MLACPSCGSVYTRSQEFCGLDGTRLEDVNEDPLIGRTFGRYVIHQPLGAGGMARVYRGQHEVLEEAVAIKILHGELAADRNLAKRFEREAKSLSRIRHAHVVEVRDFGRTEAGLLYMVMELIEGHTLAEALRRSGPIGSDEAGRIVAAIARGLAAAHDTGYVHRDLKPGNIVLDVRATPPAVKILDFGLVGLVEGKETETPLTRQGTFFGTPSYMSPEQSAGEKAGPPADMYALGVVLYELLTGSPPFQGDIRQLAQQHLHSAPPRPPLEYAGLTQLALDLLAKHPEDRPTPGDLVAEIESLELSLPPTVAPSPRRPSRRGGSGRPRSPASARPAPRAMQVDVPIERDEFSVMDGTSQLYEREALGPTRRGRFTLALLIGGLLAAGVYGLYRYEQRGPPPLDDAPTPSGPPAVAEKDLKKLGQPKPPPSRRRRPAPRKAATPTSGLPSRRTPTPQPKPTAAPPQPKPTAAPPQPKPAPQPEVKTAQVVYEAFRVHDDELGAALRQAGLSWAEFQAAAPTETRQWSAWFKSEAPVPEAELDAIRKVFAAALEKLKQSTRDRLALRLVEIRKRLRGLPDGVPTLERGRLREQVRSLEDAVAQDPLPQPIAALLGRMEALNTDIEAARTRAQPPNPADLDDSMKKLGSETSSTRN